MPFPPFHFKVTKHVIIKWQGHSSLAESQIEGSSLNLDTFVMSPKSH